MIEGANPEAMQGSMSSEVTKANEIKIQETRRMRAVREMEIL